mgnify:FL=1
MTELSEIITDKYPIDDVYNECALINPKTETDPICCKWEFTSQNSNVLWSQYNQYDLRINKILNKGTISPSGPIIEANDKIKLKLKNHQKRALHEMLSREDYRYRLNDGPNVLMYCDNVGSGKSITILSLIAERPIVKSMWKNKFYLPKPPTDYNDKENIVNKTWNSMGTARQYFMTGYTFDQNINIFNSNLIIIPHNIFNQWLNYISTNTLLTFYAIGSQKDMKLTRKEMYNKLQNCDIICVKSTMFKTSQGGFKKILDDYFGHNTDDINTYSGYDGSYQSKRDTNLWRCDNKYYIKPSVVGPSYGIWGTHDCDKSFLGNKSGYMFQRVIIDEVDSISIPAFPNIYGKYIWLITSSINNILYPIKKWKQTNNGVTILSNGIKGSGFLKQLILNSTHNRRCHYHIGKRNTMRIFKTIVRNNSDFIKDSMYIPSPILKYIECYTPPGVMAISGAIDKKALQALNAGDIKSAIAILGCTSGTEDDLLKIVNNKLLKEKDDILVHITDQNKLKNDTLCHIETIKLLVADSCEFSGENNELTLDLKAEEIDIQEKSKKTLQNCEKSLTLWNSKLSNIDAKMQGIKDRVSNCGDKTCGICASKVTDPGVTPCCQNVFCMSCISTSLGYSKECPLCRAVLNIQDISVVLNKLPEQEKVVNKLPTKLEALIDFLKANKNKRTMVFSEYEASFTDLISNLNEHNISFSQLKGSTGRICNIVDKFKNCEFEVLLLNAKNCGAGLNLQFTDNIIIYHRMSIDLENQVIGRAQRLGRSNALNITYVCYENEIPINTE